MEGVMSIHEQIAETESRRANEQGGNEPLLHDDEADPTDTTSILHGAKAMVGQAAQFRMAIAAEALALYEHAKQARDERDAQEARELAHLAEWNKQNTIVGGVQMTNAEAQDARRRVIDNDDAYAKRAVAQGQIREDEQEEFKRWMRRKVELEDKRGRGTITTGEEREETAGDRSRVGKAMDDATADSYKSSISAPKPSGAKSPSVTVSPGVLDEYTLLQSGQPAANAASQKPPAPVALAVKATGLDI